jgi:hypothetical protein
MYCIFGRNGNFKYKAMLTTVVFIKVLYSYLRVVCIGFKQYQNITMDVSFSCLELTFFYFCVQ